MKPETLSKLDDQFARWPESRAQETPSVEEIQNAQKTLDCKFHEDYAEFLSRYGGGLVGSLPVYGLRPVEYMGNVWSVVEVTREFRADDWPGCEDWYVISEDGYGNPIGIDQAGTVLSYNHDRGGLVKWADDFESFLVHLLKGE
ncbi:MAG: SMI1/KNR4 family protein [Planctomycetaceae bacterium]